MVLGDTIADFITSVKNASAAGKASAVIPYSRMKMDIAKILKKEGYIADAEKHGRKTGKVLEITISYEDDKSPRVRGVKRISKPSRRVYIGKDDIRPVKQGYGLVVLSTPGGIMTGSDAQKKGVGGEVLFEIW